MEVVVVRREHREAVDAWIQGRSERPSYSRYRLAIWGSVLVALGVAAELGIGFEIAHFNGELRDDTAQLRCDSDQLLALVTYEAGDAATSAETARKEADAVKAGAKEITGRLNAAIERLELLSPRWQLLEDHKAKFIKAIRPLAGHKITLVSCGMTGGRIIKGRQAKKRLV